MTLPEPTRLKGRSISEECVAKVAEGSDRGLI